MDDGGDATRILEAPGHEDGEADRILDAAMALAEETGWHDLRLRHLAERLEMPLAGVLAHYRDADAIADAWFARALRAMLAAPADDPRFAARAPAERAAAVLMRWFEAQAAHRGVAGQMIREKLWPSHPHHWVPMVFSLSRLMHWVREAAHLDQGGVRRQWEEIGLTLAFLSVLPVWLSDRSARQMRTRAALARRLRFLDGLAPR
jgi:AcrR family transcriptional regulator